MTNTEILIYALKKGDHERYMEDLISSRSQNEADVRKVIAAASKDGWHSFRVAHYDGSAPNFAATLNQAALNNPAILNVAAAIVTDLPC